MRALPSAPGGLTRSFLSLKTAYRARAYVLRAPQLASEGELYEKASIMHAAARNGPSDHGDVWARSAKPATASSRTALRRRASRWVRLNELLRRFMQGRRRKNEPCKVLLGYHTHAEVGARRAADHGHRADPAGTITDFNIRVEAQATTRTQHPGVGAHSTASTCRRRISLHVCLDGAIRAPEMICVAATASGTSARCSRRVVAGLVHWRRGAPSAPAGQRQHQLEQEDQLCRHQHARAALDLGRVRRRHHQRHRSFANTPYTDATAERSTPASRAWSHGPLLPLRPSRPRLDDAVDRGGRRARAPSSRTRTTSRWATRSTRSRQCRRAASRTATCRGCTRCSTTTSRRVDACRRMPGRQDLDTCSSSALPFSASRRRSAPTSRRPPTAPPPLLPPARRRSAARSAARTCPTPRPSTRPSSPSPCSVARARRASATTRLPPSYPYVDSVWNAMNALAIIARECGGVDKLHARITEWHAKEGPTTREPTQRGAPTPACSSLASSTRTSTRIAKPVVPECYAKALPFCAKHVADV